MNHNHKPKKSISEIILIIIFLLLIIIAIIISAFALQLLFVPILLSFLFYYIFNGFISKMETFKIPRIVSVSLIFVFLIASIYFGAIYILQPITTKIEPLLESTIHHSKGNILETLLEKFEINSFYLSWKNYFDIKEYFSKFIYFLKVEVNGFITYLPKMVTYILITPIFTFILLLNGNKIYKSFVEMVPNRYFEMTLMITYKINQNIHSYLRSLTIQGTIFSIISSLGLAFIGMESFIFFGLFGGISNSIPYAGPIIGVIPAILFSLFTEGHETIWEILAVFGFAQLVDNLFIQPTILAQSVSLNPIIAISAIAVGGKLFGVVGMFLAVPLTAILKVTIYNLYTSLKDHKMI